MNIKKLKINEIKIEKPFQSLFPVTSDPLESIITDMKLNGFDDAFPIIIWKEKGVVVDGHTRYQAAENLGIKEIPVLFRSFENTDDAILYAFHLQRNRRNLADEDILRCLQVLDSLKADSTNNKKDISKKESAQKRADELGTSRSKIEKARKVLEHADDDIKEAIGSGQKSINKAFNEMQAARRESGELKGDLTTGLGDSERYKKFFLRYLEEIRQIKEEGWKTIPHEKVLVDIEKIRQLVKS